MTGWSRARLAGVWAVALAVTLWAGQALSTSELTERAHAQSASPLGQWSAVLSWPNIAVHTHLLPTGKVLFHPEWELGDNQHLWDPLTGAVARAAFAGYNLFCSGHTLLADGRLLVAGGHVSQSVGLASASIYDPASDSWTRLPDMNGGRWYPTTTALANGDVLVVSGSIRSGLNNNLPQVWQAASGSWRSLTGAQLDLPLYPFMYLAPNGRVFMAGPRQLTRYLDTSGGGSWTTVGNSNFGSRSAGSSVMYDDGKVLIVGGGDPPTASAEVIDLNAPAPAWRYVAPMASARKQHNATLLPDGKVLVTGGSCGSGNDNAACPVQAAELWDPATERWTTLASNAVYRGYHSTALLLPDGRVLSAGGDRGGPNAELYAPPYLSRGPRPTIAAAPASVTYGQTFLVQTPDAARIAGVTWIRLASVTHAFDQSQRINRLAFSPTAGGLSVTAPASANLSPPGHYMLFVVDGDGVPSVASIVAVGTAGPPDPPAATLTPTPTPGSSLRSFVPVEDAYVSSTAPQTSFGGATQIKVDADPVEIGLLKFDLGPLAGSTITSAALRVRVTTFTGAASTSTQQVRVAADTSWRETTVTYDSRPAVSGAAIGAISGTVGGAWYEIALDRSAIQAKAGQLLTIAIDSAGSDGLSVYARESTSRPELVIAYAGPGGSTPTMTPTTTATASATPSPTATPADGAATATPSASPSPSPTASPTRSATASPVGAPGTATLRPVADAYVEDANPTTNYGAATRLKVDAFPLDVAYLKFDLGPLAGRTVASAVLRVRAPTDTGAGSASTQYVRVVEDSSWSESAVTFNNRPALSPTIIGSLANTVGNSAYDVVLDPAALQAKAGGLLSLGIDSPGSDALLIYARETTGGPQLIVEYR
jgi:hypothetical protein